MREIKIAKFKLPWRFKSPIQISSEINVYRNSVHASDITYIQGFRESVVFPEMFKYLVVNWCHDKIIEKFIISDRELDIYHIKGENCLLYCKEYDLNKKIVSLIAFIQPFQNLDIYNNTYSVVSPSRYIFLDAFRGFAHRENEYHLQKEIEKLISDNIIELQKSFPLFNIYLVDWIRGIYDEYCNLWKDDIEYIKYDFDLKSLNEFGYSTIEYMKNDVFDENIGCIEHGRMLHNVQEYQVVKRDDRHLHYTKRDLMFSTDGMTFLFDIIGSFWTDITIEMFENYQIKCELFNIYTKETEFKLRRHMINMFISFVKEVLPIGRKIFDIRYFKFVKDRFGEGGFEIIFKDNTKYTTFIDFNLLIFNNTCVVHVD